MTRNYFIYITTNPAREVLYIGVTNDIKKRLLQHYENRGRKETFAGKYYCYKLVYWERFSRPKHAIERETQIKNWNRKKKEALIETMNPKWEFLNDILYQ